MSASMLHRDFRDLLYVAAALLEDDEYWVIVHPNGRPLPATASKTVSVPIIVACKAFDADWSAVKRAGFSIGRGRFAHEVTADAAARFNAGAARPAAGLRGAP